MTVDEYRKRMHKKMDVVIRHECGKNPIDYGNWWDERDPIKWHLPGTEYQFDYCPYCGIKLSKIRK